MPSPRPFAGADAANALLPLYWRRTKKDRPGVRWHRGARMPGFSLVFGMCGAQAQIDGNRIQYQLLEDGDWPEPHCVTCEHRRPGTDAVRAAAYLGVSEPYDAVLGPAVVTGTPRGRRGRQG